MVSGVYLVCLPSSPIVHVILRLRRHCPIHRPLHFLRFIETVARDHGLADDGVGGVRRHLIRIHPPLLIFELLIFVYALLYISSI